MNSQERALFLVKNVGIMVLSTADEAGKPWVSPVGFTYDADYNLYWVSSKDAEHSRNVRNRPEVAIVVYGPVESEHDLDGVYFDALASELEDEASIKVAIENFAKRPQSKKFTINSMADVTGDSNWRIYKAAPRATYKRANAIHEATGQAITVREAVELPSEAQ